MAERSLTVVAPAKINLYLGVHDERDARGYHRVDSTMVAVGLCDRVTVAPADGLTVETVPATDFPMQQNTAYRAAVAMGERFSREPRVRVSIEKHIPLCAGLGGPSTDAAAVIVALAALWGIDPDDPALDDIARGIGADVPFFLHASPSFYVGGGDVLAEEYPALPELPVVLVKPDDARVSTVEAYRTFDAAPVPAGDLAVLGRALEGRHTAAALAAVSNNLAPVAERIEPRIAEVLAFLRAREGVLAADVCGSGACSFAICDSAERAAAAARAAEGHRGWWACATRTLDHTCAIEGSSRCLADGSQLS